MTVRRITMVLAALVALSAPAWAGLGSKDAKYLGGTLKVKEGQEGKTSTSDEKVFTFEYKKGEKVSIPYDQIDSLEYGQKAGRRIGVAIVVNPLFLLSKKRKHFLTLGFKDGEDKQQAAVFELGKDIIRVTLATLEARSGRKIEYQDEEARKSGRGN